MEEEDKEWAVVTVEEVGKRLEEGEGKCHKRQVVEAVVAAVVDKLLKV